MRLLVSKVYVCLCTLMVVHTVSVVVVHSTLSLVCCRAESVDSIMANYTKSYWALGSPVCKNFLTGHKC